MMQQSDRIRLQHMLDSIQEALSFISGKSRADLDSNRMLVLSLIKDIEMVGEAANKMSAEVKVNHPEIPWVDIVGMRHHLIHEYFDVDLAIVWSTVTKDLPPLQAAITKILS